MVLEASQKKRVWIRLCVLGGALLLSFAAYLSVRLRPDGLVVALLRATHAVWKKPRIFSAFHLIMLAVCLACAAVMILSFRKIPRRALDGIVFSAGVVLLFMEVYKQLYYLAVIDPTHYNFGILPLQFCSYALYLFLIVPLLPEGRVKDVLYAFCGLYQTMGGCIVMAYPTMYAQVSLCVHTMLWHTVMISVGVLILALRGYGRRYLHEMLPTALIFLATMTVATVCNLLLTPYAVHSIQPLNLFYMSPYETNHYILISDVRRAFGWFPSLVTYAALFIGLGSHLMWLVARLLRYLEDAFSP